MSRVKYKENAQYKHLSLAETAAKLELEKIPFSFDGTNLVVYGSVVPVGNYIQIPRYFEACRPLDIDGAIAFLMKYRWPFNYVGCSDRLDIWSRRTQTGLFSFYIGQVLLMGNDSIFCTTAKVFEEDYVQSET